MPDLLILGQRRNARDSIVPSLLAAAHFRGERVRCLCCVTRPEMYVSRTGRGFTVKRLPYSGDAHATGCVSFGPVVQRTSSTTRGFIPKFDMHLAEASESTLKWLQDLWRRAGLTYWRSTFEGRRLWAVVRSRLMSAATAGEDPLEGRRLYIPEQFRITTADAIASRRNALWESLSARGTAAKQPFFIGELKRITWHGADATLTIRHIPALAFHVAEPEAKWLHRRFANELLRWQSGDGFRLVLAGVLDLSGDHPPSIRSLALLPVDSRWLPIGQATTPAMPRDGHASLRCQGRERSVADLSRDPLGRHI